MSINSNVTTEHCFFFTCTGAAAYTFSTVFDVVMPPAVKEVPIGGRETLPYDKLNKHSILRRSEELVQGTTFSMWGCNISR